MATKVFQSLGAVVDEIVIPSLAERAVNYDLLGIAEDITEWHTPDSAYGNENLEYYGWVVSVDDADYYDVVLLHKTRWDND